jgi:hypothetical protein
VPAERPAASGHRYLGGDDHPIITIREATDEERRVGTPPLVAGGKRCSVPKYVCVGSNDRFWLTFFMPTGGETREEAVFWAERAASKNGLRYVAPEGWENVEGSLPDGG